MLEAVPLNGDFFPNLENPFRQVPGVEAITSAINTTQLPPLPDPTAATGAQFGGNVLTGVTEADRFAALFPGDTTGQLAANRRANRNQINQTTNRNTLV